MSTFTSEERATINEWINSFVVMPPNEECFNENLVRYENNVPYLVKEIGPSIIETIEIFSSNNLPQDTRINLHYTDFQRVVSFILDLESPKSVYSLTIYEAVLLEILYLKNGTARHHFKVRIPKSVRVLCSRLIKDSDLNASA